MDQKTAIRRRELHDTNEAWLGYQALTGVGTQFEICQAAIKNLRENPENLKGVMEAYFKELAGEQA